MQSQSAWALASRTAASGISSWQRMLSAGREAADLRVGSGHDDDDVLAVRGDEDDCEARRRVDLPDVEVDDGLSQPGQRLLRIRVLPHAPDHPHVRSEACGRDGLIRSLSTRDALECCAAQRLARPRQTLHAGLEVEVDGADDGQLRRQARGGRPPRVPGSRAGRRDRPRATSGPARRRSAPCPTAPAAHARAPPARGRTGLPASGMR